MINDKFLAGFINATGIFKFYAQKYHIRPTFMITTSSKNMEILFRMKDKWKIGRICMLKNNFVQYAITKQDECFELSLKLDGLLYGLKREEFELWKIGVNLLEMFGDDYESAMTYFKSMKALEFNPKSEFKNWSKKIPASSLLNKII